ncbi:MAG TPA: BrnT family toxin [Pyrinomonadaceae bacterium]|jgi:hypothetical protein
MYDVSKMFVWDETKREQVIKEHGVDFAEIGDVFNDPFALYFEDYEHSSDDETRFRTVGQTVLYGLVAAVFIYTDEDKIRFITARHAENWMVKEYEKNRKRL